MQVHAALGFKAERPKAGDRLAIEIQFRGVLNAQNGTVRGHARSQTLPLRLKNVLPAHVLLSQKAIGRLRFRPAAAGCRNTCRGLLGQLLRQQHRTLVQSFVTKIYRVEFLRFLTHEDCP